MLFQESCYHQALIWHAIRSTYRLVVKSWPHHHRVVVVIHVTFQKRTRDMTALYRTTLPDEPPIVWLDVIGTNQFVSCNFKSPISRDSTKRNLREAPCEGVWTDDSNRHWHFHMVVHSKPIAVKLTSPATYHMVSPGATVRTSTAIKRPYVYSWKMSGSCG